MGPHDKESSCLCYNDARIGSTFMKESTTDWVASQEDPRWLSVTTIDEELGYIEHFMFFGF